MFIWAFWAVRGARTELSGEIISIHVEDDGDILGEGNFPKDGLDVIGEGAGVVGAEDDLEAKLIVGADEWAGEDFAEGHAAGEVFLEA